MASSVLARPGPSTVLPAMTRPPPPMAHRAAATPSFARSAQPQTDDAVLALLANAEHTEAGEETTARGWCVVA
nr:bbp1(3)=putative pheromone precursor [Schizophyllum commune, B beta 1 altermorph, Peptide, 72 aa] [Schizophyllum commune]